MDEPVEPTPERLRAWSLILGVLFCRILNSAHWALVGGLGWGFGTAVAAMTPWPGAETLAGAAGLGLAMLGVLTVNTTGVLRVNIDRSEYAPIQLAAFGGAAVGSASLALLAPFKPDVNLLLGGGVGFFVSLLTCVMKQHLAPVKLIPASTIAIATATLFVGVGSLVGGPIGWAAAGGISLFVAAMLAECWRREPAVEIDANEQPVRTISRREMCWHTARQSWSLMFTLAWGWHGVLAGLAAYFWAVWAADHNDDRAIHQPFLTCGGLAAFVIILTRLGLLKPRQPSPPSDVEG
jgi:hypothetical protein